MPKRPIEDVYRDSSIPDDRKISEMLSELGDDLTLADLRRAYKGFEKKIQEEAEAKRRIEEETQKREDEYKQVFQNAAARIAELEQGYADVVSKFNQQPQPQPLAQQPDPWTALVDDPVYGPVVKAWNAKANKDIEQLDSRLNEKLAKLSKLDDIEKGLQKKDQEIQGLTKFISDFGEVFMSNNQKQSFQMIPDRDPEITFEQAFQEAQKNELYDDAYKARNPNFRIPDVTKGYEKLVGPRKMEKLLKQAREDGEKLGRETALRESRNQTFFPPPPSSSALGNAGNSQPKNMDEAFRELSNDPNLNKFPFF